MGDLAVTNLIIGLLGGLGAIAAGLTVFVRRFSRDRVELTKDRAEIDVISILMKQRDEAVERVKSAKDETKRATSEKDMALEDARRLSAEVLRLNNQVAVLRELVRRLAGNLEAAREEIRELRALHHR